MNMGRVIRKSDMKLLWKNKKWQPSQARCPFRLVVMALQITTSEMYWKLLLYSTLVKYDINTILFDA